MSDRIRKCGWKKKMIDRGLRDGRSPWLEYNGCYRRERHWLA
ncbi:MAG TPA: hypothetical protein VGG44_02625 [Tepidisphaeraceae bacterium]